MLKYAAPRLSLLTIAFMAVAGIAGAQNITPPPQPNVAGTTVTTCTGNMAQGFYDAVNVPAGATCTITNGLVNVTTGGVTVGAGATFFVASPGQLVISSGSLNSTSANTIEISNAQIHGHVHLNFTTGGDAIFTDSFVGGTLSVAGSNVVGIVLDRNTVGALLEQNNQCSNEGGCNSIKSNTIAGAFACVNNTPPPSTAGNTVGGNSEGQCAQPQ
jgi:hypothetical protein